MKTERCGRRDAGGNTALHQAAYYGNHAAVASLVAAGAEVAAANGVGTTALHIAAVRGYTKTVETLVAAGARWEDGGQEDRPVPSYAPPSLLAVLPPDAQRVKRRSLPPLNARAVERGSGGWATSSDVRDRW